MPSWKPIGEPYAFKFGPVTAFHASRDGSLFLAGTSSEIVIWRTSDWTILGTFTGLNEICCAAFHALDSEILAVAVSSSYTTIVIHFIRWKTGETIASHTSEGEGRARTVAFTSDGAHLLVNRDSLEIWALSAP